MPLHPCHSRESRNLVVYFNAVEHRLSELFD